MFLRIQVFEVQHSFSPGKTELRIKCWNVFMGIFGKWILSLFAPQRTQFLGSLHTAQALAWNPCWYFQFTNVQILQGENVKTSFSNFIAFVCWACEIPEVTLTWFSKLNFLWHPRNSYCISNNYWQRKSPSQLSACPRVHSAGGKGTARGCGKGNCPGILSQCSLREVTQLSSGYFVLSSDF